MPEWLHNRARHIQAKNPSMPESEAFAIATQQSHALGKSPNGYGTSEGRQAAKEKYDTPKDDKRTADPGGVGKELEKKSCPMIAFPFDAVFVEGFSDELEKIAGIVNAARRGIGRQVVKSVTQVPENRDVAEKFVRDAAWGGVKSGLKRNARKGAVGLGIAGAGAVAAHRHGQTRRAQEREQLIQDVATRLKKTANLADAMPTTLGEIRSTIPKSTMKPGNAKYTKVNTEISPSPIQQHQPVLSPPPVRG